MCGDYIIHVISWEKKEMSHRDEKSYSTEWIFHLDNVKQIAANVLGNYFILLVRLILLKIIESIRIQGF